MAMGDHLARLVGDVAAQMNATATDIADLNGLAQRDPEGFAAAHADLLSPSDVELLLGASSPNEARIAASDGGAKRRGARAAPVRFTATGEHQP